METVNARIESTQLGGYDGGASIMTCWLFLDFEGSGQGFGGYGLDRPVKDENGVFLRREGTAYGMEFITRIIDTVGVDKWEDLVGKYIRVRKPSWGASIEAIGHITKDKWFNPSADLLHLIPTPSEAIN